MGLALLLVGGTGGAYYTLRRNRSKRDEKGREAMDKVYEKDGEKSIARLDHRLQHEKEEMRHKNENPLQNSTHSSPLPSSVPPSSSSSSSSGSGSDKKLQTDSASQDNCAPSKKVESFP